MHGSTIYHTYIYVLNLAFNFIECVSIRCNGKFHVLYFENPSTGSDISHWMAWQQSHRHISCTSGSNTDLIYSPAGRQRRRHGASQRPTDVNDGAASVAVSPSALLCLTMSWQLKSHRMNPARCVVKERRQQLLASRCLKQGWSRIIQVNCLMLFPLNLYVSALGPLRLSKSIYSIQRDIKMNQTANLWYCGCSGRPV